MRPAFRHARGYHRNIQARNNQRYHPKVASSHHSFLLEIDPNGGYESGVEGAVGVLVEEARFADTGVAERQELHQVVVIHSAVSGSVEGVPGEIVSETR